MSYSLTFSYNREGRGYLRLLNGDVVDLQHYCRTGSINTAGKLVNALRPDVWYIIDAPVSTTEPPMVITKGNGWKIRLWLRLGSSTRYERTRYLIHPDGNLPGTEGCIGCIKTDALDLRKALERIQKEQRVIPVTVISEEL